MASARKQAPWKRSAPKGTKHRTLSAAKKRSAKAAAKRAGRPYPNLVDNMRAAKKKSASRKSYASRSKTPSRKKAATRKKTTSRKKTAAGRKRGKRATRKSATKGALENPRGGLTAAGRRHFRKAEGAHLQPGVKKAQGAMSLQEMRRKGSWAVRFYARAGTLPPLTDEQGKPTRFALTARAWGEPVPKTPAAARRIAAKGRRLLATYERRKAQRKTG